MTFKDIGIIVDPAHGVQQKTTCPKCSHTRAKSAEKCLSVNLEDETFNCKHCGWAGSLGTQYTHVDPRGKPLTDAAYEKFFAHRGITKEIVDTLGITYGKEFLPQTGETEVCILFPYFYKGKLVNYKFRDENKNFKLVSGARLVPFNFDYAINRLTQKTTKRLFIVEGEPDAIVYSMCDKEAISVPNGANIKNNNLQWLTEVFDDLIKIKDLEIVIATDNDEPGKKLRFDIRDRLINHFRISYVDFGEHKDGNDYFKAVGNLNIEPIELKKPSIFRVKDSLEQIQYFQQHGYPQGQSVMGIKKLFSQHRGEFTLMTGIPNHGKTSFTLNMASEHAITHQEKVGIISLEKSPLILSARLLEITSRKPIDKLSSLDTKLFFDDLNENVIISRPAGSVTEDVLFNEIEYMVGKYGVTSIILDPYSHVRLNKSKEEDAIAEFLIRFSTACKDMNYHGLMVAHPRKMEKHGGKYQVPKPYDISGSHHFYNVPDNIFSFYKAEDRFELHVQKIREHYVGEPGIAYFQGDKDSGVFMYDGEQTENELNEGF